MDSFLVDIWSRDLQKTKQKFYSTSMLGDTLIVSWEANNFSIHVAGY
jgi:hypothetical protein